MAEFTVIPESFTPIAGQLRDTAASLRSAWDPVQQQTAAVHFGRGDDPLSPLIQAALQVMNEIVEKCVQGSVDSLGDYADGLDAMTATFRGAEDDSRSMFRA